jgi:hypothetical protein
LIERILVMFLFGIVDLKRMKSGQTLNVRLDSVEAKVESRRV